MKRLLYPVYSRNCLSISDYGLGRRLPRILRMNSDKKRSNPLTDDESISVTAHVITNKYSKDKEKLSRILKDNSRMLIDREAALVIKTITNTAIEISEKEEKIDMCKAIDDMLSEREAKGEIRGIEIGEFRMLVKQVKKGRLTIEEAAEDAAMSVEEFRKVMESNVR